jgi:hypothetical protein
MKCYILFFLLASFFLGNFCSAINYYALDIAFGKDSTKAWDGEVTFSNKSLGDKFLYAGIELNFMKTGRSVPSENKISWEGKAEARKVFSWAIPFNKMVAGYTPEKDKFPFDPFDIEIHFKAHDNQALNFNTLNGSFSVTPSKLNPGEQNYFLDSQVVIIRTISAVKLTDDTYIAERKKYHGYPSITSAPDGTTYTAYATYYEGMSPYRYHNFDPDNLPLSFDYLSQKADGDRLNLVIEKNGEIADRLALTTRGRDIAFTTSVFDNNNNTLWVCWTENVNGNKDVFAISVKNHKPGKIKQVTKAPGPDLHPALSANNSGVWLTWQGYRNGNFDILLTNLLDDNPQEQSITNTFVNEWQPDICTDSKGNIAIAWDSYQNGNYDIFYTKLDKNGKTIEKGPVASTLNFEARPSVVFDKADRLWIAYEKAGENWGKDNGTHYFIKNDNTEGLFTTRSIRLVCIHKGEYYTTAAKPENAIPKEQRYDLFMTKELHPAIYNRSIIPHHYICSPSLTVSKNGHLCLVYKKNADTRYTTRMENCFMYYNGKSWSKPVKIGASHGQMHEKPAITGLQNGTVRIIQASEREAISDEIQMAKNNIFRQDIWMGQMNLPDNVRDFELNTIQPLKIPDIPESVIQERQDVKKLREYRLTMDGRTYRILKGDTHRHTMFSGDGAHDSEIEDSYRYALDVAALDWMNNGDHDCGYNEYHWYLTQKYADIFHTVNYFTPLFGWERSCGFPDGHRNVIFAKRGVRMLPRVRYNKNEYKNTGKSPDTELLYKFLRKFGGICVSHTTASEIQGTDWRELESDTEPVMEIYQGERMTAECRTCPRFSYDYPLFSKPNDCGFLRDALENGHHIGVIASSDHKSTHISFAMVYAEEFTRQGIMEGLKKRHTYAATDNIILDGRMNDKAMMGDVIEAKERKISINVIGTDMIQDIVVVKNGKEYPLKHPVKKQVIVEWTDTEKANNTNSENYYYVRIMQKDGELAWSSPIWGIK